MRKALRPAALWMIAVLLLSSAACATPSSTATAATTAAPVFADTPPEETLSAEDAALAERAAEILWSEYALPAKEHFEVNVSRHVSSEKADVEFRLYIGGYRTWESYSVYFAEDGSVAHVFDTLPGEYSRFLEAATPARIAAAEAALTRQVEKYDGHSGFYLSIDDEGALCLTCEVIIDKLLGDHEHVFYTERICSAE